MLARNKKILRVTCSSLGWWKQQCPHILPWQHQQTICIDHCDAIKAINLKKCRGNSTTYICKNSDDNNNDLGPTRLKHLKVCYSTSTRTRNQEKSSYCSQNTNSKSRLVFYFRLSILCLLITRFFSNNTKMILREVLRNSVLTMCLTLSIKSKFREVRELIFMTWLWSWLRQQQPIYVSSIFPDDWLGSNLGIVLIEIVVTSQ